MRMNDNLLRENMRRFGTKNLQEQAGLNMQDALSKASTIDGLNFGKYLKNIKGIVTSLVSLGEEILNTGKGGGLTPEEKEAVCTPIRSEMNSLAPLVTDLLDRMKQDTQSDLIQKGLLQAGNGITWDEYAALMSKSYNTTKIGLMTLIKPVLNAALAAAKLALKASGSFYVDSAIVTMLSERIKTHCGAAAGATIASLMMDSISSVIPVKSTGVTC